MGKIVMPKNSALLNEIEAVLKIYYENDGWLANDVYKSKLKEIIGDNQYSSSYTKKAQITSYFGFTMWQDIHNPQSFRRITKQGRSMYEAIRNKDKEKIEEILMFSLENTIFGRQNYGCPDSNSDIEPPALFIRASIDLGYLTYKEFAYLLWKLEDKGGNYTDSLEEIRQFRNNGCFDINDEAQKYTDAKPIMILVRWGFLDEEVDNSSGKHIMVNKDVFKRFEKRLKNLRIYNIDKDIIDDQQYNLDERPISLYIKFKSLVAWFVKQLNINNNLEKGLKTSGKGCDGDAIQNKYIEWRDYGTFTLDVTIQSGYLSASNKANYIHKTCTGINIRPNFDKASKKIKNLYIDLYNIDFANEEILKILDKEYDLSGLSLFDDDNPNDLLKELFDDYCKVIEQYSKEYKKSEIDYDSVERIKGGENVILYGVPGAGKSWTIKNEYCSDDSKIERLVFHPDYTYSDFVGQILPKLDEKNQVTYIFTPGPFTNILKKAYLNPDENFYLVIEEVNRGNAPAIFGDIFQLLDRNVSTGSSEYSITNSDIAKEVYGDENHKVSIPSNLSILGTMNTSDQNVFTLDTAFQRRWNMRLIQNRFADDGSENEFANTKILDTSIIWEKFLTEINSIILNKNIRMTSSEDKRLGTHFIAKEDLEFDHSVDEKGESTIEAKRHNKKFAEKVLKYLWDDAFKFNKGEIFDLTKVNSLEKVIEKFTSAQGDKRFGEILKQNIYDALVPTKN